MAASLWRSLRAGTMGFKPIKKNLNALKVTPNLDDYARTCAEFAWEKAERAITRLPGNLGLNIAYECVDRHANSSRRDRLALRWISKSGEARDISYEGLRRLTNRFANVLRSLGIGKGDRVFVLAGRIPELYTAALGTLKNGSVFCPLFSAFGPEPIRQRLSRGSGRILVTTPQLYRQKVAALREALPELEYVLLVGPDGQPTDQPGTLDFHRLMADAAPEFTIP